jgi:hypothetical protein
MDSLVEVTSEHLYGPTTVGAIQEFIRLGDINADTFVINSCDGTRRQIRELPALFKMNSTGTKSEAREAASAPASAGISIRLQERIRDLEQTLREERRAYAELEEKYNALVQQNPPPAYIEICSSGDSIGASSNSSSVSVSRRDSSKLCSHNRAYFPPCAINSWCVPRSIIRP